MSKVRYPKEIDLIGLPEGEKPVVGELYHTSWASKRGFVWRCISINEENKTVQLRTPKTKRDVPYPTKWSDLRLTRSKQVKLEKNGLS